MRDNDANCAALRHNIQHFVSENSALGAKLRQPDPGLVDWPWSVSNSQTVKQVFRNAARPERTIDPVLEIEGL